jgi:hypothetical protein
MYGRFPLRSVLAGAMISLPWILFATIYFGSPIPTSAIAKLIVYQNVVTERFPNRHILIHQFVGDPVHAGLFAAGLAGAVWIWRYRRQARPAMVWFLLYHGAILASRAPVEAFGWYFVPPLPLYCAFTTAGLSLVWNRLARYENLSVGKFLQHRRELFVNVGLAAITLFLIVNLKSTAKHISFAQQREDGLRKPAGEWMAHNVPQGSRVMMEAIGYVGYFSRLPVLDMVGLVSPEVIPIYQTSQYPLGEIVVKFRPDYLLLRVSERDTLEEYSRAAGRRLIDSEYDYIRGFPGEGESAYLLLYRRRATGRDSSGHPPL